MNNYIKLYQRLYSFSTYNLLLYANFMVLFTVTLQVNGFYLQVFNLLFAYLFIGIAGYFLNDYFDVKQDSIAKKFNITSLFNKFSIIALIFIFIIAGLILVYTVSFVAFWLLIIQIFLLFIYSFNPIRLKEKGFWGIITDAIYAHTLPAVILLQIISEKAFISIWLAISFIMLCFVIGVRDILIHQCHDFKMDIKSSTKTFYVKHKNIARLLILYSENLIPLLIILVLGFLFNQTHTIPILAILAVVFAVFLIKILNNVNQVNFIIRAYIISSSIVLLLLAQNKLVCFGLLLHPFNLQFIKLVISNFITFLHKLRSLIHHFYKAKFTLFINYLLYYLFLPFGRNLKDKPLYKKSK
ncbi:MAG: UbiA family prenyltransferase [Bacteroidia bacterium]|nr:UbiA family prenyltransferase [Bacteroidia bacterium]